MNTSTSVPGGSRLGLDELPLSPRTIMLDGSFFISDNRDDSAPLSVISFPNGSKLKLGTPFMIHFSMLLVCEAGYIRIRLRMEEHELRAGTAIVTLEGTIGECLEISPDARLYMIAFSKSFGIIDSLRWPNSDIITGIIRCPQMYLEPDEAKYLRGIYDMLHKRLSDSSFQQKREFASICMRAAFCFLSGHLSGNSASNEKPAQKSRASRIFDDFIALVDIHALQHRDLAFYASRLFVSPKYLGKVVALAGGRPARSWICMRVVLEAKVLLREGRLSVQQISDRLGFANQSFFGTFFKRYAGMAPTEYRNKG